MLLNLDNDFSEQNKKGKTMRALRESRKVRDKFLSVFGFVPESILVHDRKDKSIDLMVNEGRGYSDSNKKFLKESHPNLSLKDQRLFRLSHQACDYGALSRFSQNIGRLLVKFYCPEKGIIYDPFAGHNSRMEISFKCGMNYIGIDISKEFMEANRKIRDILLKRANTDLSMEKKNLTIKLIEGSSDKVDLPDNYADFTITSPPYWDIEYYGDEPEQLGNAKTYNNFLNALKNHMIENFRILKDGAFCCWCINDFKKNGIYYDYHADVSKIMRDVGFILESIYIIDLGRSVQAGFIQILIERGVFPKRHEYCIVCRKPGEKIMGFKGLTNE